MEDVLTKGNVIVNKLQIDDIIYEFQWNFCIKSKVITLPQRDSQGYWTWKCETLSNGKIIDYGVSEEHPHYAPNIYDFEAYQGCKML